MSHNPFNSNDSIHIGMNKEIETRRKRKEGVPLAQEKALQNVEDIANERKQQDLFNKTQILHDNPQKVKRELERIKEEKKKNRKRRIRKN